MAWGTKSATLGSLFDHFGSAFRVKKQTGVPKVAQEHHPGNKVAILDTFGMSFLTCFRICDAKRQHLKQYIFLLIFALILHTFWDGLMCNPPTPAQSKHTFLFSHLFFEKVSSRVNFGIIFGTFFGDVGYIL